MWYRKEPIIQVSYNDKIYTYLPKKVITKYQTEAELESFRREAFNVPANNYTTWASWGILSEEHDNVSTGLKEIFSRSERGGIQNVLIWIRTNHLNSDLLREVQAGVEDMGVHMEPLPLSLHIFGPVPIRGLGTGQPGSATPGGLRRNSIS
ncbi:hypothetical protein WJX75_002852 [Coccomyxa subellipsoidea]|uniref:Uncharacterized protein n=1 Tax=Coccomyxa subellipsoidea TaxID=248742 RepID=A0ABR2YKW4_9CHLO